MGPVRGRLIAGSSVLASLFAAPAWAEVCDKARPNWDGSHVSLVDEVIAQLSNPPTALLIAVCLILVLRPRTIFIGAGVLLILAYGLLFTDPLFLDDVRWEAKREGCIGNQELWWAVLVGIAAVGVLRISRNALRSFT